METFKIIVSIDQPILEIITVTRKFSIQTIANSQSKFQKSKKIEYKASMSNIRFAIEKLFLSLYVIFILSMSLF